MARERFRSYSEVTNEEVGMLLREFSGLKVDVDKALHAFGLRVDESRSHATKLEGRVETLEREKTKGLEAKVEAYEDARRKRNQVLFTIGMAVLSAVLGATGMYSVQRLNRPPPSAPADPAQTGRP